MLLIIYLYISVILAGYYLVKEVKSGVLMKSMKDKNLHELPFYGKLLLSTLTVLCAILLAIPFTIARLFVKS